MKHLFGIAWLFLCTISFAGCSDDDETKEPEGSITLNMMNEENGKTLLGESDVYINKSNNFKTSSCLIADMGKTSGLGAPTKVQLDNTSQEVAVLPNHLYHIYAGNTLRSFPSGKMAVRIGGGYYKAYVMAPITQENTTTGITLKYVLAYPETNGLPEYNAIIGRVDYRGHSIEIPLSKDSEVVFDKYLEEHEYAFDIQVANGKLKITLLEEIDRYNGPYGDYQMYIRSGSTFTYVMFQAGV